MKKVLLLICMFCVSSAMMAQEEKTVVGQEISKDVAAIQTAIELAKLGYSTYSPTALIEAARILAVTKCSDTELENEGATEESVAKKERDFNFDPMQVLADAKEFAGKDKTLLALIKKTEKEVKEALKVKGEARQRDAVNGPFMYEDVVYSKSEEKYTCKFWANELAEVAVVGDGDTDLDLYIYDSNGNLITKDEDLSDNCYCSWVPAWTGTFTIKVKNRGDVYNKFVLLTN